MVMTIFRIIQVLCLAFIIFMIFYNPSNDIKKEDKDDKT